MIDVIFCAGGNRRYAQIAIENGFKYGAQIPCTLYFPIYFADQNWKKPDRKKYMDALAKHQPYMATVLDWEREDQLSEVLDWAEEASQYIQEILIIPKVCSIDRLPHSVNGKNVRLAYSVPSKYGATAVPVWGFAGWPVHLLGGSPSSQMNLARYLDVRSVDGNGMHKLANKFCKVWCGVGKKGGSAWMHLRDLEGFKRDIDAPYEAFRRSCVNIMEAWKRQCKISIGG